MKLLTIDELKSLCANEDDIFMTFHVAERCRERNISADDILSTILNGEIIENYPNDYPFPSALVFGYNVNNQILHVVAGVGNNKLWIITAYYPDTVKWENDLKTRKAAYKHE